jgi:hypothetical protein
MATGENGKRNKAAQECNGTRGHTGHSELKRRQQAGGSSALRNMQTKTAM